MKSLLLLFLVKKNSFYNTENTSQKEKEMAVFELVAYLQLSKLEIRLKQVWNFLFVYEIQEGNGRAAQSQSRQQQLQHAESVHYLYCVKNPQLCYNTKITVCVVLRNVWGFFLVFYSGFDFTYIKCTLSCETLLCLCG